MSRALILIAQSRFLKRELTQQEAADCLAAWKIAAGGKTIRIPDPPEPQADLFNSAADLHMNGWSIRKIARKLGISKSNVQRALSQKSAIPSGQQPA